MTNLLGHLGSALLLIAVGVLWLMYLVPGWVERHRARATKRNTAQIQDALNVIASHQGVPQPVEAEVSARTALRLSKQARHLQRVAERKEQAIMRSQERQAAQAAKQAAKSAARPSANSNARTGSRVRANSSASARRGRLLATTIAAIGLVLLVIGLVRTGAGAGWTVLAGAGALVFVIAGAVLVQVNVVAARPVAQPRPAARPVARRGQETESVVAEQPIPDRAWTPHPLPQPLSQLTHERALEAARAEAGIAGVRTRLDGLDEDAETARRKLDAASQSSVGALREALSQVARIEDGAPDATAATADGAAADAVESSLAPETLDEILRRRRVG